MRVVFAELTLNVLGLLAHELDVLSVRVQITSHLSLEVSHSIHVVARQNLDVHLLQDRCRPLLVCVHLAEQGEDGLVCGGFVAVDGGLEVDSELVRLVGAGEGEEDVGNCLALLGEEVGGFVGHPVIFPGECSDVMIYKLSV